MANLTPELEAERKKICKIASDAGLDFFETIFEEEKSIGQLVAEGGLPAYTFREVKDQFEEIYKHLDKHYG